LSEAPLIGGGRGEDPARLRRRFLADVHFPLDPFQVEAFDVLDSGSSVLVSAPTGSGKTLIAEYAIARTLARSTKSFYTTPLKALSNQKYKELCAAHGEERVGLLTGDTAIRASAPIVVMTTEVLRNMLLAGSDLLGGLETVVLDEVHYLQDPYRGGVWEEVLVLAPPSVTFVCLSATVNNANELGAWLRSIRGPVEVVVEVRRPITLRHHFAVQLRSDPTPMLAPLISHGAPSDDALRIDQMVRRSGRTRMPSSMGTGRRQSMPLPVRSPRRIEMVELMEDEELLPSIVFIFSRAACDDAVRQCLRDGVRLTGRAERAAIRATAERHVELLDDDDLTVLGYPEWLEGLEAGLAAHHAGLVPAYREAVEECFATGLLKVVFATETLSLGINMPARTVVIERFTKFGGAGRATLTSGEYAQLTGRAGRRGHDDVGHAVVEFSPETALADAARVALAPPPDLRSTFRPTYNLAVNLVRRFDRETAHSVLRSSFAQWQAQRSAAGRPREMLTEALGRRLAVLEELGYVHGWALTEAGLRLSTVYHESDLLVAEALSGDVLEGAEPSVIAGVLSAVVFEKRRARKVFGAARSRRDNRPERRKAVSDRLGERRRLEIADRLGRLRVHHERIRALEEVHTVPRTSEPEPGLATAVASWARGASFGATLDVAARDAGEMAPGDFVRTVRQLADLVHQVGIVAPDPAVAAAAMEAHDLLLRDVVAAGTFPSSAIARVVSP